MYEVALSGCIKNLDNFAYEIFVWITLFIKIFYPQLYTDCEIEISRHVVQEI